MIQFARRVTTAIPPSALVTAIVVFRSAEDASDASTDVWKTVSRWWEHDARLLRNVQVCGRICGVE